MDDQDKACNKLVDRVFIRTAFADTFKDKHPFIITKTVNGQTYYISEHKAIQSMLFRTEQELVIANAIYEAKKENFSSLNDFREEIKFVFRIIQLESDWA